MTFSLLGVVELDILMNLGTEAEEDDVVMVACLPLGGYGGDDAATYYHGPFHRESAENPAAYQNILLCLHNRVRHYEIS